MLETEAAEGDLVVDPFRYFTQCSLVARPLHPDRFVLNTRVYEVRQMSDEEEMFTDKGDMIWHGIFLAVEADDFLKNLLGSERQ